MLHIVDFNWKYLLVTLPYSLPHSRKILGSPILEDFEGFLLNLDKGQELIYICTPYVVCLAKNFTMKSFTVHGIRSQDLSVRFHK